MTDDIERDVWKSMPDDLPYKASVKRVLIQAKAADVRPVVRGRWIWDDEGFHCSECFFHAYGNIGEILSGYYNFCPNCGAEMVTGCNQLEEGNE